MNTILKITSYNIHMGLEQEAVVKNIADLAAQGVSVFCLQEVWKWKQPADIKLLLLNALGPEWRAECFENQRPGRFDYGLCMVWKYTILKAVSFYPLPLPLLPKAKLWEKAFFRFHGVHDFILQRGALIGTYDWNGKLLRVSDVHLDFQGRFEQRKKQLIYLSDYLATLPPVDYEVICGDFNALGWLHKTSKARAIQALLPEGFANASRTSYSTIAGEQLDYIFVKNMIPEDFQVIKISGSDHFPIMVQVTPK